MKDQEVSFKTLMQGLAFGESPRWHDGRLWFSDWMDKEIIAVDPKGRSEVMVRVPFTSFPFSIDWLPDGRLLVISDSEQALLQQEADGSLTTLVDLRGLSAKGWNEIVVDGRGNTYVNCVGFDLLAGEQPAPGSIALIKPDGSVKMVAGGLAFPNGMAITSDNSTLIVAESYGNKLTGFDIATDGSLSGNRVWAELGDNHPDGICLDNESAVWFADVAGKHCVRAREGGEVLQSIQADRGCFACMLGGEDGKTQFTVAADWRVLQGMTGAEKTGQVSMASVANPGAGWPGN